LIAEDSHALGDILLNVCNANKLIGVEAGRLSGISGSSDAHRKLCSVRKRSVSNCFICAKA